MSFKGRKLILWNSLSLLKHLLLSPVIYCPFIFTGKIFLSYKLETSQSLVYEKASHETREMKSQHSHQHINWF